MTLACEAPSIADFLSGACSVGVDHVAFPQSDVVVHASITIVIGAVAGFGGWCCGVAWRETGPHTGALPIAEAKLVFVIAPGGRAFVDERLGARTFLAGEEAVVTRIASHISAAIADIVSGALTSIRASRSAEVPRRTMLDAGFTSIHAVGHAVGIDLARSAEAD